MRTILFIMLPFPSHYFVAFGTANYLKKEGYRVVFTGEEKVRTLIENEGFEFQKFQYITEYQKLDFKIWIALLLKTILDKSYTKQRYKDFYSSILELNRLYKSLNPELILIDHHIGEYALFLNRYDSKIVILNTKLSCYKSKGIPPLGIGWVSKNSFKDKIRAEFDWLVLKLKCYKKKSIECLVFVGKSDSFFYKRWAKKYNIIWNDFFEEKSSTYTIIKHIPKLITYPHCIEYPFKDFFLDEWYIETPFQKNESEYITVAYQEILEKILNKKENNLKIIYCALGTISFHERKRADLLLLKIINAVKELPNVELILADDFLSTQQSIKTTNIHIFKKVPQLHILQYCDLMITHGGLNSISECIQAVVPILAFPLIKDIDHFGNSARVVANGFGLKGNIEKNSSDEIKMKIMEILNNIKYKENIKLAGKRGEEKLSLHLFFKNILTKNGFANQK